MCSSDLVPLGPVTYLALSWDDPQRKAEVVRSADADIAVTIGAEDVATVAKLRLRGAATEWRFTAPANADVSVSRYPTADAPRGSGDLVGDRAPNLYRPEPGQTVWRLEFR